MFKMKDFTIIYNVTIRKVSIFYAWVMIIESCELEKNWDITLDNHKQESQIKVDKWDDNLVNIIGKLI